MTSSNLQELLLWVGATLVIILVPYFTNLIRKRLKQPDPLNEATIYLAYGQKKQALELLEAAIKVSPERNDIAAKIAELKKS